ncbi:MAG: prepilin-type N-terminal cleavage/methylation domain-containing protein [Planctomycetaceae bacterium]
MPRGRAERSGARSFARSGFTLLELLLVLVILLAITGLVTLNVQGVYQRHRLRDAAETVRKHLATARLRAMDTGVVHFFQFEPGGGGYRVAPFEPLAAGVDGAMLVPLPELVGALPETMRFDVPEVIENLVMLAVLSESGFGNVGVTGEPLASNAVAPPILFAPDGTATDAVLSVVDPQGGRLDISIRGLTGAATIRQPGEAAP